MTQRTLWRVIACLLTACLLVGLLAGCQDGGQSGSSSSDGSQTTIEYFEPEVKQVKTAYPDKPIGFQLEKPRKGEQIAVLHTNYGDICFRLFPEAAPKAVENFITHIQNGTYNGVLFHRVIKDFAIQAGAKEGPFEGKSIWGEPFEDEFDSKLFNLRGALTMANMGIENYNEADFAVITTTPEKTASKADYADNLTKYKENFEEAAKSILDYYNQNKASLEPYFDSELEFFKANYFLAPNPDIVPDEVWDLYSRVGGIIRLDGQFRNYGGCTVFGQVFEGMDVVDAIAQVEADASSGKPYAEVRILSAEVLTYDPDTFTFARLTTPPPEVLPHNITTAYADKPYGFQLEKPAVGEEIAVLHTTEGDIKIRLFPEGAPKAVENFTTHIRNGYYNNVPFHRVINDFMIQTGDPTGTGAGGESIWKEDFGGEYNQKLLNLRGALAMANTGLDKSVSSQFFINQTPPDKVGTRAEFEKRAEEFREQLESAEEEAKQQYGQLTANITFKEFFASQYTLAPDPALVPDEVWALYQQHGGNIHLDGAWRAFGGHTVFGQVFEGMDVVDAIAQVETDSNDKPTQEVKIISAEIVKYTG